jgi:hypothetical protein
VILRDWPTVTTRKPCLENFGDRSQALAGVKGEALMA